MQITPDRKPEVIKLSDLQAKAKFLEYGTVKGINPNRVGIININRCDKVNPTSKCDNIIFYNSNDKIIIERNEYNIISNKVGFDLVIQNNSKLNKLLKIINPSVDFCIQNKKHTAKGNFIYDSNIPSGVNFFFPIG